METQVQNTVVQNENVEQEGKDTFKKVLRIILSGLKKFKDEWIVFPLSLITHPVRGFDEFKRDKKGKMWVALLNIVVYMILSIASFKYTGFVISNHTINDIDFMSVCSFIIIILTSDVSPVIIFLVFAIFCSVFEEKFNLLIFVTPSTKLATSLLKS